MKRRKNIILILIVGVLISLCVLGGTKWKGNYLYQEYVVPYNQGFNSTEIDEKVANIKEKYGIDIVYNLPEELISTAMVEGETYVDEPHRLTSEYLIDYIDNLLKMYSDKAINEMPKKWFLINRTETVDNSLISGRVIILGDEDVMVLTTSQYLLKVYDETSAQRVLHHEIFHSVLFDKLTPTQLLKFIMINENCSNISDYACTSIVEETAEAWAQFLIGNKTQKGQYLFDVLKDYINIEG